MMSRGATRVARSVIGHMGPRYFSGAAMGPHDTSLGKLFACGATGFLHGNPAKPSENVMVAWFGYGGIGSRQASTLALGDKKVEDEEEVKAVKSGAAGGATAAAGDGGNGNKEVVSYWGVEPPKVTKEDGSEWSWNCFRPWETYKADLTIDLEKKHVPVTFLDKFALWTVKTLRWPTDLFFQRRYGCRAMMLETVAAVPGMVGGMLLHCKSLRRFEHSGGWIKALLEEAENERMHLMTFMEVSKPRWYERALVFTVQGVFFNAYFLTYILSPKLAHRIVGYLEEEAIHSYTEFLKELDKGTIENVPAPAIAIDYWRMPPDSTLRDVVMVVRADEAHHRDVNHFASDIHYQGHELKKAPAPLGYH
ncbi:ubiquinol oxidase 2, mitochondrial-like [Coffea eugenioides]|uniref:ubiquinol oxidase 2, mitochondrial-like n=1 Tax=Coffea eugenioides TaxID=49369 RepID=UPI000F613B6F|nr:ubiquinol oxidase 2, mitochondrial-like [Coffea eugenioides]XP_027182601.1 ubiquinol oxidase 2, mitochondrial-like [Coffea eugenioides]